MALGWCLIFMMQLSVLVYLFIHMCVCAYVRMCVFVIRYEALLAID